MKSVEKGGFLFEKYTQWYETSLEETTDGCFTASVVHYGGYEFLNEAYDFLMSWIKDNGYKIKNPSPLGEKDSMILWIALFFVSGILTTLGFIGKRRKRRIYN